MIFNDSEFYPTRDGERSPYLKWQYKDTTDLNAIILLLKNLDYPFIADDWYRYVDSDLTPLNPLGRYISLMNIGNYKPLRFQDSKHINQYSKHLKRLYREVDVTIYNEVVDKLPDSEIKTEEIKSDKFKKPKYLIGYDENDKPIVEFKYIKDMNVSFDCATVSAQDAKGGTLFCWDYDKILNIKFNCEEMSFPATSSETEEPKYIFKNGTSIEIPKAEEETNYELEIDKFIKELNL